MSREHDQANQTESPLAQRATLRERDKKEICGESFACPKITVLQKPLASKALIEPLLLVAVDNPDINTEMEYVEKPEVFSVSGLCVASFIKSFAIFSQDLRYYLFGRRTGATPG
ncbi:hypothetical protein [Moorena sp. SIO4A5]|uniref:hypothetical protein n=1 Tax=Moorena sp. SIO4A5 TaxID=2607838 RepID=UPI0013CD1944|nr:hypothetical protein [Moorena sp. SIO4A5]NEO23585.1 hypothetical protein [Moorena sp. SIO4A5]